MNKLEEIKVPDLGDSSSVEIIEVLISCGEVIEKEQTLITLESDKASMDIPSPYRGKVKEVLVRIGDKVSKDDLILRLEMDVTTSEDEIDANIKEESIDIKKNDSAYDANVVVIGAGPGGYTAAFRAADLGLKTILIEKHSSMGGVCLNVGCIPSKALLHVSKLISEIKELKKYGIDLGFKKPEPAAIRNWATSIINKLTLGLASMAKQRNIEIIHGTAKFTSANSVQVNDKGEIKNITFESAIIAAGSKAIKPSLIPEHPCIMDSTDALLLKKIPKRMLIMGGGIIGLEMATVYAALGTKITIVEMLDSLISACDRDIVQPLYKKIKNYYENIYLETKVVAVKTNKSKINVSFENKNSSKEEQFDALLVATGRKPNGHNLDADRAGVYVDGSGFIPVDEKQRTNIKNIFAIGDIVGQPMLAHKASHEAKVAAEVIAGYKVSFDNRIIPSVAYTTPEIAWVGLSESEAKRNNIDYGKGVFPWAANGRSLTMGSDEGITKILFDKNTNRILGAAIVGPNAGDLIAECGLAIEMGADAADISLTIHPHPTLSETVAMAAEMFEGIITDLYLPKKN